MKDLKSMRNDAWPFKNASAVVVGSTNFDDFLGTIIRYYEKFVVFLLPRFSANAQ